MVYVDKLFTQASSKASAFAVGKRHGHKWCHLWADTVDELVKFALALGLKRAWLQNESGRMPHFDLVPSYRQRAIANGAVEIDLKEFFKRKMRAGEYGSLLPHQPTAATFQPGSPAST